VGKAVTWPIVALGTVLIAAVFGIYFVGSAQDRSALLGVLIPLSNGITAILISRHVRQVEKKVEQVEHNTNGRLEALINDAADRVMGNEK